MESERQVVIAVDGSDASAYAVSWGIKNFLKPGDNVLVLCVAPHALDTMPTVDMATEYTMVADPTGVGAVDDKDLQSAATSLVDEYMRKLNQAKIKCTGEVVQGEPGTSIAEVAAKVGAEAVIVGSHDYGLLQRSLLGSISDHVLHHTSGTVIVVRPPSEAVTEGTNETMCRKVVIAVDDSSDAVHAFVWALQNFCTGADKVVLVHVQHPVLQPTDFGTGQFGIDDVYIPPDTSGNMEVKALDASEKLMEKYMKFAEEKKIHTEGLIVPGATAEKLSEELTKLKADAVIIGTHERDLLNRILLGSVTDTLVHHAPCPVLVVKQRISPASPPGNTHVHTQ